MNQRETGDLGQGSVGKLLLRLALPTITAQLVNALYNMVDRIYIGHIPVVGRTALTGVGVCMSLIMIISAFAALTAMGGATRASIFLGRGDRAGAEKILGNCVTGAVSAGLILTVVFLIFSRPLLMAFGASEETIGYAVQYMKIYALGTVFVELALGLNAFITAQGFASVAMVSVLIGAVANMILDAVLILGLGMGVAGAALATIISQGLSALWVVRFLLGKKTGLRIRRENLGLDWKLYGPCLALGLSPFIMQSTEGVISVCFNASLQRYGGDLAVGAMTILASVMQFPCCPSGSDPGGAAHHQLQLWGKKCPAGEIGLPAVTHLLPELFRPSVASGYGVPRDAGVDFCHGQNPHFLQRLGHADLYGGLGHLRGPDRLPADLHCPGQCQNVSVSGGFTKNYFTHSLDPDSASSVPDGRGEGHGGVPGGACGGHSGSADDGVYLCLPIPENHEGSGGDGMNPESLIFDVDGTLWDSVDLVVRGWNLALEEAGREPTCTPEGIRPLFGKTMDEIALAFLPDQGPEERRRLMNSCMAWEDRVMQDDPCEIFYPQVRQTLEALSRRHRLFIVSNCQKGYIELLLEKGKLGGLIRDHACFGETGLCKGETIRLVMERNRITSAAYVGDTQGDLEAARLAGIPFVWAAYGFGNPEAWEARLEAFCQLTELF